MNIKQALQLATETLIQHSHSEQLDAQVLLAHTLQCNTAHLIAWPEKELSEAQLKQFRELLTQRQQGRPVAHLTGTREFWSLAFEVNASTLIPRPETEILIEFILQQFPADHALTVLDLGTGTGAIAISLAKECSNWRITGCDISASAIELARQNSQKHTATNTHFIQSDWFSKIDHSGFDIIVSNPPYIASNDPHLQQGDVRFEPDSALTSGITGMDAIKHITKQAKNYLADDGWLIIEHGYDQETAVANCFASNGYRSITQQKDLSGQPRMTAAQR